eukprot:364496-Chlamydomonas_euryale.AAC.15
MTWQQHACMRGRRALHGQSMARLTCSTRSRQRPLQTFSAPALATEFPHALRAHCPGWSRKGSQCSAKQGRLQQLRSIHMFGQEILKSTNYRRQDRALVALTSWLAGWGWYGVAQDPAQWRSFCDSAQPAASSPLSCCTEHRHTLHGYAPCNSDSDSDKLWTVGLCDACGALTWQKPTRFTRRDGLRPLVAANVKLAPMHSF